MIEPVQFGFNEAAFETNSFQNKPSSLEAQDVQTKALKEFKRFVDQLRELKVKVLVYADSLDTFTPDSIFPNNWISTHASGELFTYPMAVANRRAERRNDIMQDLCAEFNLQHRDLSAWENENPPRYLEGTGGMIFDRVNQICYAALSPRAHISALEEFCELLNYEVVAFEAFGKNGEAIYHTNVMLSVGETFVCVGIDTIASTDRDRVISSFESAGKEVITFSNDQIYTDFAGNMLQIKNTLDESILVLSKRIFLNLTEYQKRLLTGHNAHLLPIDIATIEKIGGGSVRCMLAEIFKKTQ
ncbi:MAG: arginine deiminase-related protein [Crocinitomicaceae bacterium]|nr:arginine deiminase-related protein [Crocinitomicaceae bacterium]